MIRVTVRVFWSPPSTGGKTQVRYCISLLLCLLPYHPECRHQQAYRRSRPNILLQGEGQRRSQRQIQPSLFSEERPDQQTQHLLKTTFQTIILTGSRQGMSSMQKVSIILLFNSNHINAETICRAVEPLIIE